MKANALTWVLAAALVVALIVIAFLLGRESRPSVIGGPVARYADVPPAAAAAPAPPAAPAQRPEAPPPTPKPGRTDVLITNRGGGEARVERGASVDEPEAPTEAGDIASYFEQVDAIRAGPEATRPDAFARTLAAELGSGDTSGLERLAEDVAKATKALEAITPPPECRDYHRTLLQATKEGGAVLQDMNAALQGRGDLGALTSRAQALQRYEKKLEKMRKKLER